MTGWRVACGICWGIYTLLLSIGGIAVLGSSIGTGLTGMALAALAGWYDYRIWTLKARHLWIFILF